jgi:hypothetical protein
MGSLFFVSLVLAEMRWASSLELERLETDSMCMRYFWCIAERGV